MQNKKGEKRSSFHSRFFPKNQKGQGLSTNAIILIVLGVIVLAVLVIGFTMGWARLAPWLNTNNVDIIVNQCGVACSTNALYSYCSQGRDLKADDGTLKAVSCYYLSEKKLQYGIEKCPSISCGIYESKDKAEEWCSRGGREEEDVTYLIDTGQETKKCLDI